MICWSCQQEVLSEAEYCPYCEAELVPEPSVEDAAAAMEELQVLTDELANEIRQAFGESALVGDCPACGSSQTGQYEDVLQGNDAWMGRCFNCGQAWCLECGEVFDGFESLFHDCSAVEGETPEGDDWGDA